MPVGKSSPKTGGKFPPMIATYSDFMWDWCARTYGGVRGAEKLLARDARTVPHTARGWLRRHHAPQGEHFTELLAANPELEREYLEFVAGRRSEADMLRAETRALQQKIQSITARLDARGDARDVSNPADRGAHVSGDRS